MSVPEYTDQPAVPATEPTTAPATEPTTAPAAQVIPPDTIVWREPTNFNLPVFAGLMLLFWLATHLLLAFLLIGHFQVTYWHSGASGAHPGDVSWALTGHKTQSSALFVVLFSLYMAVRRSKR